MGQCFGKNSRRSANELAQHSHKQIELHLREDQTFKKRVFFTGTPQCIGNIFSSIESNQSIHQIKNSSKLLVSGFIRKFKVKYNIYIPTELQLLCFRFFGKLQFPNHYEFYPKMVLNQQSDASLLTPSPTTSSTIDDISNISNNIIPSYTEDTMINNIEYQLNFPNISYNKINKINKLNKENQSHSNQLMITYHNLQCFKKKDYYLKWIHLVDDSLSVIFVADLSQIGNESDTNLLSKDMEKFRRLMYCMNGKYDSRMPILILSGIDKFNQYLSNKIYKTRFEAQFNEFKYHNDRNTYYEQQALQYIKNKYLVLFESNLINGTNHWTKRKTPSHKLFIRTINDENDITEVQNVWIKLNKAIIHGNIMHELRNGGIAV